MHFLHAVANDRDRVHVFLFGTRLSNVTRQLRARDPEATRAAIAGHLLRLTDDIHRLLESEAGGPKMPPTSQPQDSQ